MNKSGLDNNPNSIFRASRTVKKIINKKLKKDEDAKLAQQNQQMGLKPNIPSNVETDVNKNLSLFSLDIKQLTTLIDAFVDYINGGYLGAGIIGGAKLSKQRKNYRKVRRDDFTGKEKKKSGIVGAVKGPQIHSAPVADSESESERSEMWARDVSTDSGSDSENEGSIDSNSKGSTTSSSTGQASSRYDGDGGDGGDDGDGSTVIYGSDEDSDISEESDESEESGLPNKKNINLVRELARISNLLHHAMSLWEDNISPNILYLSKIKMSNFLNSNIIKNFEDSIEGFDELYANGLINNRDYPELYRVFVNTNDDLDNLFKKIEIDIKKISGIDTGSVENKPEIDPRTGRPVIDPRTGKEKTNVDRAVERTITGAGFLHFPSPYNNYMNHSRTKYLM